MRLRRGRGDLGGTGSGLSSVSRGRPLERDLVDVIQQIEDATNPKANRNGST